MQFTVALKIDGKASHCTTEGQDELAAAIKVTCERPQNKRGDARHLVLDVVS